MIKVRGLPFEERERLYEEAIKLHREEGLSAGKIGGELDIERHTIQYWIYGQGQYTRGLPYEEQVKLYEKAKRLKSEGKEVSEIARILNVNRGAIVSWIWQKKRPRFNNVGANLTSRFELAYSLGVILGDGCLCLNEKKYRYAIQLSVKDRDFAEAFQSAISKIVGRVPKIYFINKRGMWVCVIHNKILFNYLDKGLKKHEELVNAYPAGFLKGFFDSEGLVNKRKSSKNSHRWTLAVDNTNTEILGLFRDLLDKYFGIFSYVKVQSKKGSIAKFGNREYKRNKDVLRLTIERKEDVKKFAKHIGCSIIRKQKVLNTILY
ncbi:MAG: hypothetical protein KAS87_06520 [Candidatus Omnitrophica bacterium]|nr:hypothetical protein [Candidatus Omnitrophota bacterium]